MDPELHWERVYQGKSADQVSWYRPHLDVSLGLVRTTLGPRDARIIDVGGGEATFVDDLVASGYSRVDVLDLSETALDVSRARLGDRGQAVRWLHGDVTDYPFEANAYDLWHDRAVFHFLTKREQREAYARQALRAVKPGGYVIVATFGPEGPTQCSGLDVVRYDAAALHDQFGARFQLVDHHWEDHVTPAGRRQQFLYCVCRT